MKKIVYFLLFLGINSAFCQSAFYEDFESGTYNSKVSVQTTGSFSVTSGVKEFTHFGSTRAFGFGKSTCGSNCFDNFQTVLIIDLQYPTYINFISWKEMEIGGNWGSQGTILLDGVLFSSFSFGAQPVNSHIADAAPRSQNVSIGKIARRISLVVTDITSASEIMIDDLLVDLENSILGYEYWFNDDYNSRKRIKVTPVSSFEIFKNVPSTLDTGVHTFHFRAFDNLGRFSSIVSDSFYRQPTVERKIIAYEYWFDNNYTQKILTQVSPVTTLNLSTSLATDGLVSGIHTLHFRALDDLGNYSSTQSKFFYKVHNQLVVDKKMIAYEYWFDNNYSGKTTQTVASLDQIDLLSLLNVSALDFGIHTFHIRFKDNNMLWSSTQSQFFFRIIPNQITQNEIAGYEYWLDNDYSGKTTVASAAGETINLNAILDFAGIPAGLHTFNIRFKDKNSVFSSTQSQFFYKIKPQTSGSQNLIAAYEYWFNDNYAGREKVVLNQPVTEIHLLENLNLSEIPAGNYTLNYRFKDTQGQWSSVTSDEIQKLVTPKAVFGFTKTENCDSTVFTFTNTSVDANSFLWDFGDGQTSTLANPQHTFYSPGAFTVSLKAVDSQTQLENTTEEQFRIKGNTLYGFQVQSCGAYTSPSGKYVWNTTGIYQDTLVNADGCDSLLTVNLTVNPVLVPAAPAATSVARCGTGSVTLTASGCNGIIRWFENATTSDVLTTGNSYVTPILLYSREYFVECMENACLSTRVSVSAILNININHPLGTLNPGIYKVSDQISSRATVSGNTTYQAAKSLMLLPGFQIPKGTVFIGRILGCD